MKCACLSFLLIVILCISLFHTCFCEANCIVQKCTVRNGFELIELMIKDGECDTLRINNSLLNTCLSESFSSPPPRFLKNSKLEFLYRWFQSQNAERVKTLIITDLGEVKIGGPHRLNLPNLTEFRVHTASPIYLDRSSFAGHSDLKVFEATVLTTFKDVVFESAIKELYLRGVITELPSLAAMDNLHIEVDNTMNSNILGKVADCKSFTVNSHGSDISNLHFGTWKSLSVVEINFEGLQSETTVQLPFFQNLANLKSISVNNPDLKTILKENQFLKLPSLNFLSISKMITEMKPKALNEVGELDSSNNEPSLLIHFQSNMIEAIKADTFWKVVAKNISLSENRIYSIEPFAFNTSFHCIVDISTNDFIKIPKTAFSSLVEVVGLSATQTEFECYNNDCESGEPCKNDMAVNTTTKLFPCPCSYGSGDSLVGSNTCSADLGCESMFHITDKKKLRLKENSTMTANCLSLNFYGQNVESIDDNVFDTFLQLTLLDLRSNSISRIPYGLFDALQVRGYEPLLDEETTCSVFAFDIVNHHLTVKDMQLFDLGQCQSLDLSSYTIETIDANAFHDFTALTFLDLENNSIHSLPPNVFASLDENLITSENGLKLDQKTRCTSFAFIIDDKGELQRKNGSSYDITSCQTLNLTECSIRNFRANPFFGLIEVKEIDLSFNLLSKVEISLFEQFQSSTVKLQSVRLNNNLISSIEPLSSNTISDLYLNDNNISFFQTNLFIEMENLTVLRLQNNPIDCCDSLTEIDKLMSNPNMDIELQCIMYTNETNQNLTIDNIPQLSEYQKFCYYNENIISPENSNNKMIIAGIVVGAVTIFLVLGVVVIVFVYRKKSIKTKNNKRILGVSAEAFVNVDTYRSDNGEEDYIIPSSKPHKKINLTEKTLLSGPNHYTKCDDDEDGVCNDANGACNDSNGVFNDVNDALCAFNDTNSANGTCNGVDDEYVQLGHHTTEEYVQLGIH